MKSFWRCIEFILDKMKTAGAFCLGAMTLQFPEHVIIYLVALCFLMFALGIAHEIGGHIVRLRRDE